MIEELYTPAFLQILVDNYKRFGPLWLWAIELGYFLERVG